METRGNKMKIDSNNERYDRLRYLTAKYHLTTDDVADILDVPRIKAHNWRHNAAKFDKIIEYALLNKLKIRYFKMLDMVDKDLLEHEREQKEDLITEKN